MKGSWTPQASWNSQHTHNYFIPQTGLLAPAVTLFFATSAYAHGVATDKTSETIVISASRIASRTFADTVLPTTTESKPYSTHYMEEGYGTWGFKLTSKTRQGWNASASATIYDITADPSRASTTQLPAAASGAVGSYVDNSGTGWKTLDLQSTYAPTKNEKHALSFGYHISRYNLDNGTFTSNGANGSPSGGPTTKTAAFSAKTDVQALSAQNAWKFLPKWLATYGVRYEKWQASDGRADNANTSVRFADRKRSAWSPKASVSFLSESEWLWKASIGKGVRFPTVTEFFQGSNAGNTILDPNPGLRPERSIGMDLSVQTAFVFDNAGGTVGSMGTTTTTATTATLRASFFQDYMRDAIYSQTNILVFPNVTNFQNADRVRTSGIELSARANNLAVSGFDLSGSLAFTHSVILENANNPALAGKTLEGVPRVRANLTGAYRHAQWTTSVAMRYSGQQHANPDKSDFNPESFGAVSSYTIWDARLTYRIGKAVEASFGIENLTNQKYFAFHPYAGRTFLGEFRASF